MIKYQNATFLNNVSTNTTVTYRVTQGQKTNSASINLEIFGTDSPDGTVSFIVGGLNDKYTPFDGLDLADNTLKQSITSLDSNGAKLEFDLTGWENFRLVVTGLTTGSITAAIVVIHDQ